VPGCAFQLVFSQALRKGIEILLVISQTGRPEHPKEIRYLLSFT
jgi:hypothetical protein